MMEAKWRFPGNGYGFEVGLSTGDLETFKTDTYMSLAREICQNSTDAIRDGESKVIIEFKSFKMNRYDIPGVDRLEEEIDRCINFQMEKEATQFVKELSDMKSIISSEEIECLRISDFNTKGLTGVNVDIDSPFYYLTKGSGITTKSGISGGSKGVGKNASFVASGFNTVFYSTFNEDNERASMGVTKLTSSRIPNSDEKTQGIGFYSIDEKNNPLLRELNFDKDFNRQSPGTDIYILGFRKNKNWQEEFIAQILDSFLFAIYNNALEVYIDDIKISKSNLKEIIDQHNYPKAIKKSIYSQFILLDSDDVYRKKFDIDGYGEIEVYAKNFKGSEKDFANNGCIFIRRPYMKIKTDNLFSYPTAAICVLEKDNLNILFKDIENPQHNNWEFKRKKDKAEEKELKRLYSLMKKYTYDFVIDVIGANRENEVDLEGAGDYLPQLGSEGENNVSNVSDKKVIAFNRVKSNLKKGLNSSEDGEALEPDLGSQVEGEGLPVNEGKNDGTGGSVYESDLERGISEGDRELLKISKLDGMNYKFYIVDKKLGRSVIAFKSLYDASDAQLELFKIDSGNQKYKVNILKAWCNNQEVEIEDYKIVNLKLDFGQSYKLDLITDLDDLYSCEVRIYASKK